jgi:hypothetical protein
VAASRNDGSALEKTSAARSWAKLTANDEPTLPALYGDEVEASAPARPGVRDGVGTVAPRRLVGGDGSGGARNAEAGRIALMMLWRYAFFYLPLTPLFRQIGRAHV